MKILTAPTLLGQAEDACGAALRLVRTGIIVWWLLSGLIWVALALHGDGDLEIPPSLSYAMHWAFGLVALVAVAGGLMLGSGTLLLRVLRRHEHARRRVYAA